MNATVNTISTTSTYSWLIKRELWEHRAIFIAPLIFAVIILVGALSVAMRFASELHAATEVVDIAALAKIRVIAYFGMAAVFSLVMTLVIGYYALDALHAERRDRSVLFWKSLPISDIETVISKLAVIVVVAPAIGLAFAIVTQLLAAIIFTVVLAASGHDFIFRLWDLGSIGEIIVLLAYAVLVQALWYLPVWAWCLLASSWANRSPFLVAVIPPCTLAILESIVFRTRYVAQTIGERLNGVFPLRSAMQDLRAESGANGSFPPHLTDLINPSTFLAMPQLWIGLIVAAGLIAATIWMRRYREAN